MSVSIDVGTPTRVLESSSDVTGLGKPPKMTMLRAVLDELTDATLT
jgi:hypothetical protein